MSKNASGAFARQKVVGSNPKTPYQIAARARYSQALIDWQGLKTSVQDSWISAAASGDWDTTDSLGRTVVPTGQQLFVRVNIGIPVAAQPLETVPSVPSLNPLSVAAIDAEVSAGSWTVLTIRMNESSIPSDREFVLWCTVPLSSGIRRPSDSRFKLLSRYSKTEYGDVGGVLEIKSLYEARLGVSPVGRHIFFLLQIGDTLSGKRLDFYRDYVVVI